MSKIRQNLKYYFFGGIFLLNVFVWYAVFAEDRHGVLTVSFLDVGQGDSILIDAPSGNQMLIDGGPDKKVLRSLGKVMPFYDHSIDLIALTHPHSDHLSGLVDVLSRYSVLAEVDSGTQVKTSEFQAWKNSLESHGVREIDLKRGNR